MGRPIRRHETLYCEGSPRPKKAGSHHSLALEYLRLAHNRHGRSMPIGHRVIGDNQRDKNPHAPLNVDGMSPRTPKWH